MIEYTPQQQAFLKAYLDPQSSTWSNAKQSAIKAGYSEEYADNIMHLMPDWLSGAIGDNKLVQTALTNLAATLESENDNLRWDATKFTLKGLKSDKFSEKKNVDVTSGGEKISFLWAHESDEENNNPV
jgi:hypothetical protein